MLKDASQWATRNDVDECSFTPNRQHHTMILVTFEHDVEKGLDITLERFAINGDNDVFRLQAQRTRPRDRAQLFNQKKGVGLVLAVLL